MESLIFEEEQERYFYPGGQNVRIGLNLAIPDDPQAWNGQNSSRSSPDRRCVVNCCGASSFPNRPVALISRAFARWQSGMAIAGSSTGRRSGRVGPIAPIGEFWWQEPIRQFPKHKGLTFFRRENEHARPHR